MWTLMTVCWRSENPIGTLTSAGPLEHSLALAASEFLWRSVIHLTVRFSFTAFKKGCVLTGGACRSPLEVTSASECSKEGGPFAWSCLRKHKITLGPAKLPQSLALAASDCSKGRRLSHPLRTAPFIKAANSWCCGKICFNDFLKLEPQS